jgi:hypothetical protein
MQIVELLNLRTEFEDIISDYKIEEKYAGSDINSLYWFIENGHKSNSLRNDFKRALEIAEVITTEYYNDTKKTATRQ